MVAFANQWQEWWVALQSPCRKKGAQLLTLLTESMNISMLKKGGALGIMTVLIGLRWWGECPELQDRWEVAVKDMLSVFQRFTA